MIGHRLRSLSIAALCAAVLGILAVPARASVLDQSAFCNALGCIIFVTPPGLELYVATTPPGTPANLLGFVGPQETFETGTLTPPANPGPAEGDVLGVDLDGDGNVDQSTDSSGDGFLDASDVTNAFAISATTQVAVASSARRDTSFYACASLPFELFAQASLTSGTGDLAAGFDVSTIGISVGLTQTGTDDGFTFGQAASTAGFTPNPLVSTVADLSGGPTRVATLGTTVGGLDPDLADHCVRVDATYTLTSYDLSQGAGDLQLQIDWLAYVN